MKILISSCLTVALTTIFFNSIAADDRTAALLESEITLAEMTNVSNNRAQIIAGIVSQWATEMGANDGWKEEFTAALEAASDQQLHDIQSAASYSAVQAVLLGQDLPTIIEGVVGIEQLGSLTQDLVFTPVVPCRFFQTNFDVYGPPGGGNPGTILSYRVHGTSAQLAPQGHTAGTGCPSPQGEPVAIAANFTVIPYGKGHIRAWPFSTPQPFASILNYNSTLNSNLANAAIVATCYLCGNDISVSTWFGSSDSLGDVMGYFYPADDIGDLVETRHAGYDISTATVTSTDTGDTDIFIASGSGLSGDSVISVNSGDEVVWTATTNVYKSAGTGNTIEGTLRPCYQNTVTSTITALSTFQYETDFCVSSTSDDDQASVQVSGRVASMPSGSYRFGFCASWGASYTCGNLVDSWRTAGSKVVVTKYRK